MTTTTIARGVNATRPLVLAGPRGNEGCPDLQGSGSLLAAAGGTSEQRERTPATTTAGRAPLATPCAPGEPPFLYAVGGCGHVDAPTGRVCCLEPHPSNPTAHYVVSAAAQGGLQ